MRHQGAVSGEQELILRIERDRQAFFRPMVKEITWIRLGDDRYRVIKVIFSRASDRAHEGVL